MALQSPSRRELLLAVLFFFGLAAAFLAPVVFQGKLLLPLDLVVNTEPWRSELGQAPSVRANPLISDVIWETYPMAVQAAGGWRSGEVLWDPTAMTGMPGWATGKMYSNPVFLALAALVSPARAMSWAAVAHLFVGSFFLYLFLRELQVRPTAAAVGGLAFGFNGYLVGWLSLTYCTGTMAWTPAVAWCIERALRRRSLRWVGLAAIAFAVQIFSGFILFAFYSALVLGAIYGLRGLLAAWEARSWSPVLRPVAWPAAALVLGACLAAALLAPSIELYGESNRSGKPGANSFLRIDDAVRLIAPEISGTPVAEGSYQGPFNYSETDLYFGIVPLIGLAAALFSSRKRTAWIFLGVGLVPYLAVLGLFPARQLVTFLVPVFLNTFPGRVFFMVAFCWSVAAGLGVEALLSEHLARRWALVAVAMLAVLALVCWTGLWLAPTYKFPQPGSLLRGAAFALAAGVALMLLGARRIPSSWVGSTLVVLLAIDLVGVGFGYNPAMPETMLYPTTPSVASLQEHEAREPGQARILTVNSSSVLTGMSGGVYGLHRVSGYSSWVLERYSRYVRLTGNAQTGGNAVAFHGCCSPLLDALSPTLVYTSARTPLPDVGSAGDLLSRLPMARVEAIDRPAATRWRIGDLERPVLYQPPPSRVEFPFTVTGAAVFRAAIALDPAAWSRGGDGVRFEARALCSGSEDVSLFSRYLNPTVNLEERAWLPVEIALPSAERCPKIDGLALFTWPGPAGNRYSDWAGWAEPSVEGAVPRLEELHGGPNRILRNRGAMPRARLVHQVVERPIGDKDGVEALLRDPQFDPSTTAVVEGVVPELEAQAPPGEEVRFVVDSPSRIVVSVDAPSAALLVLADSYYPGWRAWLDDSEVSVLATNLTSRGVHVPAGRHRVTFEYRPVSVRLGIVLSLVALIVTITLLVIGRAGRS